MPKLGEMSLKELIESARSELEGLRENVGAQPVTDEEWDKLTWQEKCKHAYFTSITSRLLMIDIKIDEYAGAAGTNSEAMHA